MDTRSSSGSMKGTKKVNSGSNSAEKLKKSSKRKRRKQKKQGSTPESSSEPDAKKWGQRPVFKYTGQPRTYVKKGTPPVFKYSGGPQRPKVAFKSSQSSPALTAAQAVDKGKSQLRSSSNSSVENRDPSQTASTVNDITKKVNESLRWEDPCEDTEDEEERLRIYKMNRRKRYLAAAQKMGLEYGNSVYKDGTDPMPKKSGSNFGFPEFDSSKSSPIPLMASLRKDASSTGMVNQAV
ncbi:C17orf97 [Branchiostoma lanceolatum]|uniref:C17orf97 protein n=1 Tax=Branchiostoma lanceolatum TaxID=7740 RepID=A0A8J9VM33_BRALA|nr:C17orf97 [Branchiostoma lanceolatum]